MPTLEARVPSPALARTRIQSIDTLRGLVMIIMAIDHTRDFLHYGAQHFSPEDLTQTNVVLFFTRWMTHFCAPVFVFLAGTSAYLSARRGKSLAEVSRFLLTRGLWLLFVEMGIIALGASFDITYANIVGQVIWAIGWSMIALSALIFLPWGSALPRFQPGHDRGTQYARRPEAGAVRRPGLAVADPARRVHNDSADEEPHVHRDLSAHSLDRRHVRGLLLRTGDGPGCGAPPAHAVAPWPGAERRVRRAAPARCLRRSQSVDAAAARDHDRAVVSQRVE